jgi:broad specificity phosphatase PhoE
MRQLILVKHSLPEIVPEVSAAQWRLSEAGRRRCAPLAERLAHYCPAVIVASAEPKAHETAQIVAECLGLPCATAEGLHEHDRSNVAWSIADEFEASIEQFFARPAALVLGRETADQARKRFTRAVNGVLETYPAGNLAIVAHGTVIALFVATYTGLDPYLFWRRLGLPSFVVLALPDLEIVETVEQVI